MYVSRMVAVSKDVFPRGVMVLEVSEATDFEAREKGVTRQAVDEVTGLGVWTLRGIDMRGLDPAEREGDGAFRGSAEVTVKILAGSEPQVPARRLEGLGAVVEFEELTVTPYLSRDSCDGDRRGYKCKAQMKYSLRSMGIRTFSG